VVAVGAPQAVVVFVGVLGSAVAVEQVFAIPGAGSLAVDAALVQDLPVLQACLAGFLLCGLVAAGLAAAVHRLLLGPALRRTDATAVLPATGGSGRWALLPLVVLAALVVTGLPRDGSTSHLEDRLAPPSLAHPLGADAVGHDLWGRLAHGTVVTVGLAAAITAVALLVALVVALVDHGTGPGALDVLVAVPSTVVGIVVASLAGPGLWPAALAVLGVAWLPLAVHGRTLVAAARAAGHVEAATLAGSRRTRTLVVHVLPAVLPALGRHAVTRVPATALGLSALSFIGLGADPDAAELGAMLAEGLRYLERAPWSAAGPSVVLLLVALGASGSWTRRG
jgi:peptide/nickel transport system permease protein